MKLQIIAVNSRPCTVNRLYFYISCYYLYPNELSFLSYSVATCILVTLYCIACMARASMLNLLQQKSCHFQLNTPMLWYEWYQVCLTKNQPFRLITYNLTSSKDGNFYVAANVIWLYSKFIVILTVHNTYEMLSCVIFKLISLSFYPWNLSN